MSAQVPAGCSRQIKIPAARFMDIANKSIGILAGSGQFPAMVAQAARAAGAKVFICGFIGHTSKDLAAYADGFTIIGIGQVGKLLKFFKENNVTQLCFAGAIKKPNVLDIKPDLRAAKLFFKLTRNQQGDNALLQTIVEELQSEGFEVIRADTLVPGLPGPAGVLTRTKPDAEAWESIRYGWPIGKNIGAYDIGQCLVIFKKMVAAVEALEGTDATLERGGALRDKGCVALKMLKPGQDGKTDLPSIGLETIKILAKYKYSCLAYEAGKTLFFDRDESIRLADKHGIAIIGITPEDIETNK